MVYNYACKWLRLKHQVYATELKNIIERFIQKIKDRTECFDEYILVEEIRLRSKPRIPMVCFIHIPP